MQHNNGTLTVSLPAGGNSNLFYQSWTPEKDPTAIILIAHGLGEHSGRYQHVAEFFVAKGYCVYALDHIGHGKSQGLRNFVNRFTDFHAGMAALVEQVKKYHSELPLVLLGHSLGGLISSDYLLHSQHLFRACILSGPAIKTPSMPPPVLMLINRLISIFAPKLGVALLDGSAVSRDPTVVATYLNDPLVYTGKITARLGTEMFSAMARVIKNASLIKLPLLILHGEEDTLTSPAGSQSLYDKVSSEKKMIKIYPELYHEIFNEPEQQQVLTDAVSWLDEQLTG